MTEDWIRHVRTQSKCDFLREWNQDMRLSRCGNDQGMVVKCSQQSDAHTTGQQRIDSLE